jgi:hypothetical protein
MSRATVRAAIASFLTPPAVLHLDVFYPEVPAPFLNKPANLNFPATTTNRGWAALFFESDLERSITTNDADPCNKELEHTASLRLVYRSRAAPETAQNEFDAFVDSLHTRLRSDRRMGAPSVIFEAGMGDYGIQGTYSEPQMLPTSRLVTCEGIVRFHVVEMV